MALYDDIKLGLEQAIQFEQGTLTARTTKLSIAPLPDFSAQDIKAIRSGTGMSQSMFAKYMGVSVKTVEAWESGRNHPDGAATRLLALTERRPDFPFISGILQAN